MDQKNTQLVLSVPKNDQVFFLFNIQFYVWCLYQIVSLSLVSLVGTVGFYILSS